MKLAYAAFLAVFTLAGCVSNRPPAVPSLAGKPRIPINQQAPTAVHSTTAVAADHVRGQEE